MDEGGSQMQDIMQEFDLIAANTFFQPSKKAARNTGCATYCPQKDYIQPVHERYQSDLAPATLNCLQIYKGNNTALQPSYETDLPCEMWRF